MTIEDLVLKAKCEKSLLFFARYIYFENFNRKFKTYLHVLIIVGYLERVFNGEIKRLIINIPPRYFKTELAVKIFVAWCMAKNQEARFIHLTYSDELAMDNSSFIKEYIESEAFQRLWPMELKKDSKSKKKWYNSHGGGVYAAAANGPVTGFGAGVAGSEKFAGALIIDDSIKPNDAESETKRKAVNNRYNTTHRNRVNDRNTPIIVIGQRLHEEDLPGFLLAGGSKEDWVHLNLPALDEDNEPLCPEIHTFDELEVLRQSDKYMFAGQYMQTPSPAEGGEWKKAWFPIVNRLAVPDNVVWDLYIDGAYTDKTKNDPTGFQIQGRVPGGKELYILSATDKYLEMPELLKYIPEHIKALGVKIRMIRVEPKASGKSLVQLVKRYTDFNISELTGPFVGYSKIERARASTPYIESGRVFLVQGGWNEHYLHQVATFPNAKHDEYIDLTSYGVERELIGTGGTGKYSLG